MRSLLTLFALSTAIAAVVALLGTAKGFTQSFADVYAAHSVDVVVSRQGTADRLSSSVDQQFVQRIDAIEGIEKAAGVLLETMSLEEEGIYGIPSMGIAAGSWMMSEYEMVEQAGFQSDINPSQSDGATKILYLGANLAERLDTSAGSEVQLFEEPYRVAGIFRSPSAWENGSIIFPLKTLQSLTDRKEQVTYINVVLDRQVNASPVESIVEQIGALDKRLLALPTADFVETDTRMQIAQAMAWMTSIIALVIGAIGTLNTMLTSVLERTTEIGILRAIGWPSRRIILMVFCESCGLAIVAGISGTLLAFCMLQLLSQAPAVRGILSPTLSLETITQGVSLAVGIGLLGALLPALRAAKMLPTEAFRQN